MEEIQVGEYVRTSYGIIDKIINRDDENHFLDGENGIIIDLEDRIGTLISDIVKHSKNIIDLIEVGDIVNGEKVIETFEIYNNEELIIGKRILTEYRKAQYTGLNNNYYLYETDIKTILTHEQYENNSYKIGE